MRITLVAVGLALTAVLAGCAEAPAPSPIKEDPKLQQGYVAAVRATRDSSFRATDEAIIDGARIVCSTPEADVGDPSRLQVQAVVDRGFDRFAAGSIMYSAKQWLCVEPPPG